MTNEEKAHRICETITSIYGVDIAQEAHIYSAILEAMKWKDEQIDIIMLTIEGCLRSFFESRGNTQESIDNFIDAIKTQINKNLNNK